jgi:phosphatidylglycerol---prolipoprotein diacylglyceryl transferase
MFTFILPQINPAIFKVGNFEFRWYSAAYILGIILCWLVISYFNNNGEKKLFTDKKFSDDFFMYAILGIVLGGRIGYTLFYNLYFYIRYPLEIFAIWRGGMSFHGGLMGSIIAIYLICKKYNMNFLKFSDLCAIATPIGLFLGRIANFINMELYGKTTEVAWGVVFPNAGTLPRHPSQLYEAGLEGLLLFIILFSLAKFTKIREKAGFLSGIFLIGYSISRIFIECFREPDNQVGYIMRHFTMGQILSIPLFICGIYLIFLKIDKK